ncbi:fibronectin type III domain-containing protein 5 isoform X3 [Apus apus]|uniref:fibronectin type III domain-containing protein 5 isoform X3 n=1 Tax=Apus apus TaxID=8895 RepID=UPI0021F87F04|nr:fibronectin type III domain-containing protein 5 isoform X3 [Apus apus]
MEPFLGCTGAALLLCFSYAGWRPVEADSPSAPVNVTVKHLKANSAVVTWDVLEDEVVIGFAISQQKKDVRMLRFIQEVNTTTRSCALWDLEEDTEYIVHVQSISIQGQSPASEPVLFKTPREAEKLASKNKDEVTMKEMAMKTQQLRAGEILIIVVVLFMWAEGTADNALSQPTGCLQPFKCYRSLQLSGYLWLQILCKSEMYKSHTQHPLLYGH